MAKASIRPAASRDAAAIAEIYNHYILATVVTFEEKPISKRDVLRRMSDSRACGLPWLVCEENGQLLGYAYAAKWKERAAYRYSVESSVYLAPAATSRGLGTKLYRALFSALRKTKAHAVLGIIALPNPASAALHEKFGMKKAAHFRRVGYKFGRWIDVGYWQVLL